MGRGKPQGSRRAAAAPARGAWLIVFLQLLLLLPALAGCREREASPPEPPRPRLFFLGIDGASWTVLGPLLERGELPAFRRLVEEGAYLPSFDTLHISRSPAIWTTIATGRRPRDHGILGFTARLPDGRQIPATGNLRRRRAIWEVANRRGLSVGVIGWWATWPAEKVDGYMVSDHANPVFGGHPADGGGGGLRTSGGGAGLGPSGAEAPAGPGRQVHPEEIAPAVDRRWIPAEGFPWDDFQRRGGFTREQVRLARAAPWHEPELYSWLKTFYRLDYPHFRIALDLMRERPTDLQMLYLRGPDPVQHYGWDLVQPEAFARKPPHLERDRGVIEGVYRYLDTFLGEILAALPPDAWLIVASDHGAEPSSGPWDPGEVYRPGRHTRRAKGVLFLRGPGVRPGRTIGPSSPYDLMPTMAWLLELPLARGLPGRPLTEAFAADFVRAKPRYEVADYGLRPSEPVEPSPADEEMLRSLRNLGYID